MSEPPDGRAKVSIAAASGDGRAFGAGHGGMVGDAVLGSILETADRLRRVKREILPVVFWDLDGTLLEGDCVDGYRREDGQGYTGLIEQAILDGLCPAYAGEAGAAQCELDFLEKLRREGKAQAYAFQSLIFAGGAEGPLRAHAQRAFEGELGDWFFEDAVRWWRILEASGVRCCVLSASPEFFVQGVAGRLDVPANQCAGMRLGTGAGGLLTDAMIDPPMFGMGKRQRMQEWLRACEALDPGRQPMAVAALGNDPESDGPMIEAVRASQLPAGQAVGVFVNMRDPMVDDGPHVRFSARPRKLAALGRQPV